MYVGLKLGCKQNNSASGIFQRELEKQVEHGSFTKARSDDVLLSGRNDGDHLEIIDEILDIFQNCGLRLRKEKCVFLASEVTFLGYRISKDGVSTVQDKIKPLLDAPPPTNHTQLKSFWGMLNYYHRYLPGIATTLEPLHKLLRKFVKWTWGTTQQKSFDGAKQLFGRRIGSL